MRKLGEVVMRDKEKGAIFPRHYLIKTTEAGVLPPQGFVSRSYARTALPHGYGELTYRYILPSDHPYSAPKVGFHETEVTNVIYGWPATSSYDRVGVFAWDGEDFRSLAGANANTFEGFGVEWTRSSPLPVE